MTTSVFPATAPPDVADLPDSPGVYHFYAERGALLYVGKSIHIRQRVRSHFQQAKTDVRHARLCRQVARIEVRPTAGELGALLLEAQQVKDLKPLYNKRLRRQRGLLSWRLQASGELEHVTRLNSSKESPLYGLFRSRHQARERLREMAREHGLCLRVLGLEAGQGRCFAQQLNRCWGACCGLESLSSHQQRLQAALLPLQLATWDWPGAIALPESDPVQGIRQWHVVRQWCLLGSTDQAKRCAALALGGGDFDLDLYHILSGWLQRHPEQPVELL
ncbi:GIY-YIG nuclease family protein [Halopseudomonas salegens]|uniref:Excinuclease cho n=1 Tax=Halopseudomonas salegens TaxID=1434072 RepID=A0A1H2ED11_9GAMM|nr:GIY-YIG nuclease family protein [Halopseudomonas salegens]SDT92859.1 DNA polymerase-3 subunit epsilon [Halopseudomonas salegens]